MVIKNRHGTFMLLTLLECPKGFLNKLLMLTLFNGHLLNVYSVFGSIALKEHKIRINN